MTPIIFEAFNILSIIILYTAKIQTKMLRKHDQQIKYKKNGADFNECQRHINVCMQ